MRIQNLRTMRSADYHGFNEIEEQTMFNHAHLLVKPFRQQMRMLDPAKMQVDNVVLWIRQRLGAIVI